MKQLFRYLSCTAVSILCCTCLQAETTEVTLSNSMKCTKEELMRFFPEQVVHSVLVKAKLPKEQADAIAQDLSQKDQELAKLVEDKSAKVSPNPFKNLSQRDLAIKIYRETLYEVFAKVLKAHGVKNEDQIQTLLDDLQEARSKLFIECIRKQPKSSEPSS
ncbi:MAG: hypothetical protein ACH350_05635 [Parachlamydiaceae bacterium]